MLSLPSNPNISIRPATRADLPFIDGLQKKQSKQVGFMPTGQLEQKIARGEILVASCQCPAPGGDGNAESSLKTGHWSPGTPIGYVIGCDRYFKRDDCGIVYALNVLPEYRRSFVGMALLKAQFDRSAYGCKLYCCWCAQDIEANTFWESMGFVPLAFRTGSEKKSRVHIFWQKRIRAGDVTTPWWFPSQTTGGSIREDRLVLPIPNGVRWCDEMPRILPAKSAERLVTSAESGQAKRKVLPGASLPATSHRQPATPPSSGSGLRFDAPPAASVIGTKKDRPKREKRKNDPNLVAAARELRDRWLDEVNTPANRLALECAGKYALTRDEAAGCALLPGDQDRAPRPLLPATNNRPPATLLPSA